MDKVSIKKKLVIEFDVIEGTTDFINDDEMSYIEILGALEYCKLMVTKDWLDNQDKTKE